MTVALDPGIILTIVERAANNRPRIPEESLRCITNRHTQGRLYAERTARGLVAVKADLYLGQVALARVLIITSDTVTTAIHTVNRKTGTTPKQARYDTLALGDKQVEPEGLSFDFFGKVAAKLDDEECERLRKLHTKVNEALSDMAECGSAYDALHQTHVRRYPAASRGGLPPHAGQPYGPRVNFYAILDSGDRFHPAVIEAALQMPPLQSEE